MKKAFVTVSMLAFSLASFSGCGGKSEKDKKCAALYAQIELCNKDLPDDSKLMKRQIDDGKDKFLTGCKENYTKGKVVKLVECLSKTNCVDFLTCVGHKPRPAGDMPAGDVTPPPAGDMPAADAPPPPPAADMPPTP